MATIAAGPGVIKLRLDMAGADHGIANVNTTAMVGPFALTGAVAETDCGIVPISKAGGWARLTGTDQNGRGAAIGTNVGFSPVLTGPLVFETRLELQVQTARHTWIGFASVKALDTAEPLTATTATITPVAGSYVGFFQDSQLTTNTDEFWYMAYNGGSATAPTTPITGIIGDAIVTAESQILRVEIDPNGTARWLIDGKVLQTIVGACSTTTLLAAFVGTFGTTSTISDVDVNYIKFQGNRDWTP
jgi:hypothetical protein